MVTELPPPNTYHELNTVPENLVCGPRKGKAAMFTAVDVDTDVLGDVHADAGLTELIGVSGSTL
jgi:hypothetical protein